MARKTDRDDDDDDQALPPPAGGPGFLPYDLRLRSITSSKQSFARVLRSYGRGELDETLFKNIIWALGLFIQYIKEESTQSIETRLSALETKLSGGRK